MRGVVVAHLVSVSAYAGFQWTVLLVVYPQLAQVPPAAFASYERTHQQRIARLVASLFAALVLTTALLVLGPGGTDLLPLVSAVLVLVVLSVTGLVAVPLHRRLGHGWDPQAHHRLLRVDAVRVAAATANVVVTLLIALH